MNTAFSEQKEKLQARIAQSHAKLAELEKSRSLVDDELAALSVQREQHDLLGSICDLLGKLDESGAGEMFWGELSAADEAPRHLARVRHRVSEFQSQIATIQVRRTALDANVQEQLAEVDALNDALAELHEQEERRRFEFVVEREASALPYRMPVMPWSKQGEDEWRFRKVLLLTLLVTFSFGVLETFWKLPPPKTDDVVKIPERLAQLVKKAQPLPEKPKEKKLEEKKPEEKKPEEKVAKKETVKATPAETRAARAKAEKTGVLAFKSAFSDLADASIPTKLGADARISNKGRKAVGGATRSLIVAQAEAGSGGIATASLSRNIGGSGGKIGGVKFERVTSSIGTDATADADRPLSSGPGPSRTDEEIQIVFDRYKATLYRIYNRELRVDPTLRGKLVLRITIEPDGTVSACKVESAELASKTLLAEIVARVKHFNFGPKANVPKVTILYPIDFLPAT